MMSPARWSVAELDARFAARPRAPVPPAIGRVTQVCVRPDVDQRAFPEIVALCPRRGAVGDRWERRTWVHLPDGRPDPRVQVALMEARVLDFLQELTGCRHHPGDTAIVDLHLAEPGLPVGARLRIGTAVITVSDVENDACAKFAQHYGADVLAWIRAPHQRSRRLRGLFAQVDRGGVVRPGDAVGVIARGASSRK